MLAAVSGARDGTDEKEFGVGLEIIVESPAQAHTETFHHILHRLPHRLVLLFILGGKLAHTPMVCGYRSSRQLCRQIQNS